MRSLSKTTRVHRHVSQACTRNSTAQHNTHTHGRFLENQHEHAYTQRHKVTQTRTHTFDWRLTVNVTQQQQTDTISMRCIYTTIICCVLFFHLAFYLCSVVSCFNFFSTSHIWIVDKSNQFSIIKLKSYLLMHRKTKKQKNTKINQSVERKK